MVPTPDEAVKAVWETVDRVREKGFGGAIRSSIDDLAGWAQVERPALVRLAGADGSVAIFFSDIEGSTELNERLGDKEWVRLLARHDAAVRSAIERHEGQVVKTQGDGFMAAFGSPEQAVRSAIAIQQAFDRGRRKDPAAVLVRIGIHYGDVVHRDNDIFGRNVAHAARVAALAEGGEILVSETVADGASTTARTSRWPSRARCSSRGWPATTTSRPWSGRTWQRARSSCPPARRGTPRRSPCRRGRSCPGQLRPVWREHADCTVPERTAASSLPSSTSNRLSGVGRRQLAR